MSYSKQIKINNQKVSIKVRSDADESVFNEIFVEKDYQNLDSIIKNASNQIIDIGGHTGMFSIYVRTLNPNIPIKTFEPSQENFETLKENLKQNHIQNITAKNLAVSDEQGQSTLFISEDSHNHSLVQKTDKMQPVQTTTLEKIIKSQTDLVKIDIEGAEFEIIESTPLETFNKIQNIYIEYHKKDPAPLIKKLQKAGFRTKTTKSHYDSSLGFILATRGPHQHALR